MVELAWMQALRTLIGKEYGRIYGWDPVNAPMARQWCEVMGIENPVYTDDRLAVVAGHEGPVVPPAMLQVWCMEGLHSNNYPPGSTSDSPYEVLNEIEAHGYPAVVAVNSEMEFDRYLQPGEKLYYTTRLDDISAEKTTGLGTGYFVTLVMSFFSQRADGDEAIGKLLFRVFKFRPAATQNASSPSITAPATIRRPGPGISDDTRFFWDGINAGKLLIQHCESCGALRHPPGPVCPSCHSFEWDTVESSGRGVVYSYTVMHYPEVPPFDYPNPIALVELEEGVRLVTQLIGVNKDAIRIGQPVQVEYLVCDDELTLPVFRPLANA